MRITLINIIIQLYALGVPVSLAVLFFRRWFSGTWTWSTWDTLFWVLAEGRADLSDTGDMSDFVDRLSLKYLDTETTGWLKICYISWGKPPDLQCIIYGVIATRGQYNSTTCVILSEAALSLFCWCLQLYVGPVLTLRLKFMWYRFIYVLQVQG